MSQCGWMKSLAAAVGAVFFASAAYATQARVAGDVYVNSVHPSINYGGLSNLFVNPNGTALIQFDLSSLPAGTTTTQIAKATLTVYVNRVNTTGLVSVQPVLGAWSESAVTFGSIPSFGSMAASFTPVNAGQFISVDVTSLVEGWVGSPASNYGIALTTTTGDVVFDSKENDETSHTAVLDITVTSQGPQGPQGIQGTTGPTGAQGLQGIQGVRGLVGAPGIQGATGAQGPPVAFLGVWASGTPYSIGATVYESGTSYIALTNNLSIDPATDVATSGNNWAVLALEGATGATGAQGIQGIQGLTGAQGIQGATGPVGAQGIQGVTGAQGPPVTFLGAWVSGTSYSTGATVYENGTSYVSLISGNQGIDPATDVATSGNHWAVLALAGATGPTGAIGAQGIQGLIGVQGIQGATGATGVTGPTGAIGVTGAQGPPVTFLGAWVSSTSYSIGATVYENGTSYVSLVSSNQGIDPATDVATSGNHWAVLALAGATGATGATGADGVTGLPGSNGAKGATGATGPTGATGSVAAGINYLAGFTNPGINQSPTFVAPVGFQSDTQGFTLVDSQSIFSPIACTMSGLFVAAKNYQTIGANTMTITIYHNTSPTSLGCTLTTDGNTQTCTDPVHTFSVAVGDSISIAYEETDSNPIDVITVQMKCQ